MANKVFLGGSVFWWVLEREVTAAGFGLGGEYHAAQTFAGALTLICRTTTRTTSKPKVSVSSWPNSTAQEKCVHPTFRGTFLHDSLLQETTKFGPLKTLHRHHQPLIFQITNQYPTSTHSHNYLCHPGLFQL
jgi:hypothetical protein